MATRVGILPMTRVSLGAANASESATSTAPNHARVYVQLLFFMAGPLLYRKIGFCPKSCKGIVVKSINEIS